MMECQNHSRRLELVSLLPYLELQELSDYISYLVTNSSRGGSGTSIILTFHNLSPTLQEVIQTPILVLEWFIVVQEKYYVTMYMSKAQLKLNQWQVVIAWASGCT